VTVRDKEKHLFFFFKSTTFSSKVPILKWQQKSTPKVSEYSIATFLFGCVVNYNSWPILSTTKCHQATEKRE
jgi:hypothetical protein